MKRNSEQYTLDFIAAVYPDATDLVTAFGSEEQCLRDATELINNQRYAIRQLVAVLRQCDKKLDLIWLSRDSPMFVANNSHKIQIEIRAALSALGLSWEGATKEDDSE